MKVDWNIFFPPGAGVLALPSWRNPRLYLSGSSLPRRWEESAMYPGSRWGARFYRNLLRIVTAAGLKSRRNVRGDDWPLGEFAGEVMPELKSAVVLAGTPGPAQTLTAQLLDAKGRILGYLKYAETEAARQRLRRELFMISSIPEEITPRPIKFGLMGGGEALLRGAVVGNPLRTTLPPEDGVIALLSSLAVSSGMSLEAHPWARRIRSQGDHRLDYYLETLASREWPVVIQHGDFAPWNLLRTPGGAIKAIDWEFGAMEGFPYQDLCHYFLWVSFLIYRWEPLKAMQVVAEYLSRESAFSLSDAQARALIKLAAYDICQRLSEDGQHTSPEQKKWSLARRPTNSESRAWWLTIWEA